MKKKILVSSFSMLLVSTALFGGKIYASDINLGQNNTVLQDINEEHNIESHATTSNWARNIGVKAVFAALNKSAQYVFNRAPSISYGSTRDTASSGTIHFNQGTDNVASVRKDVQVVKNGHQVELWANSNNLLYTGKIVVILTTPSGTDVINKSVGHNQYSWHSATETGTYRARYVTSNKDSWNLWQAYYHWGDLASSCTGCTQSVGKIENYSTINEIDEGAITFESINGKKHIVSQNNQKHFNNFYSIDQQTIPYTFEELYQEFFDEELNILTEVPKNINENDIVVVKDNISSIQYDNENNETEFTFSTQFGNQPVRFAGDLTQKYKAGESISLKFEAQRIYPNKDYISFNYKIDFEQSGFAPNIKDYISLDY